MIRAAVLGPAVAGRLVARDLSDVPDAAVATATRAADFSEALSGSHVAVGCFDSDVRAEKEAALATLAAGVPYISSADSAESFQALSELDETAQDAGGTIVAGLSWTPGITNLMAVVAAEEFDEVSQVRIAWSGSCLGPLGSSLIPRAIRDFSGDAAVFEDGGWRLEPGGRDSEEVFFPEPAGRRPVVLCAAAEPISLPQSIEGVRKVWVKGGVGERWAHRMVLKAADPWASPSGQTVALPALSRAGAWVLGRLSGEANSWSAARVDVTGAKDGATKTVTYGLVDQLPNLVTAPLLTAALLTAKGKLNGKGVAAPEEAFIPAEFFAVLAERGVRLARLHDEVPVKFAAPAYAG